MGIVVIGAVFVDVKGYPISSYIPNGRNVGRIEEVHGGVSRNVCEDIANIELKPTFVSLVDEGGRGLDVVEKLKKHKVNTDFIKAVPDGMGTWLAIFDNNGDVAGSISKRPDLSYIYNIIEENEEAIFKDCESICLEFDINNEIVKQVLGIAKKYDKKVFGVVSNMGIAVERRDLLKEVDCFVCNVQEAGMFFFEDYEDKTPEEMVDILSDRVKQAGLKRMVVTMGSKGAVYASDEECGICPAIKVDVIDTTGAGDSFFAGVTVGITYGKTLGEACDIGTRLAASVICTKDNVCPRFLPEEFGLDIKTE